ncbi:hypothetical protein MUA61_10240 [Staphylococcus pasteuri]|uniref:hypothetical protein n=1 Tax=Staphylococcus pasteuri TaxID=45972 RepID=UPI0021D2B179|nr:hypothetical protein [Staphylococcus pasteuri]UXR67076.1 hypothetical protein MUA61_10240 [Staphylococcus pasteuri]
MIFNLLILLAIIVIMQFIIGHFIHDIGFSYAKSIILMFLPLGIGLFILQVFYYERRFPNWNVPLGVKLRLKYMYILTFFEYVAVYVCLFWLK